MKLKQHKWNYSQLLSDNVYYLEHDESVHSLDVETLDYRQHKQLYHELRSEEMQMTGMDFGGNSDILRTNYLDMFEGVHGDGTNK